jgi:hypothetical protein
LPDGFGDGLRSTIGQTVGARTYQKVCSQLLRRAEQIENIALLITDMHTTLRLSEQSGRGAQILQPTKTLLFFDRSAMSLSFCLPVFECLAAPELDGGQTQRQTFQSYYQTGVQVDPTGGEVHWPPLRVLTHGPFADQSDSGHVFPLVTELGRVMQHQNRSFSLGQPFACRFKCLARICSSQIRSLEKNRYAALMAAQS